MDKNRQQREQDKFVATGSETAVRTTLVDASGSAVTIGSPNLALQLDEAGDITYVGEATIASTTSSAVWRIKRLDESGNPELIIKWADGDDNFDNVWDDRASLTYS